MRRIQGLRRKDNGARHSPSAGARYRRGVPSADLLQLAEAFDRVLGLDQTTSRKANRNLCTVGRDHRVAAIWRQPPFTNLLGLPHHLL
jgi:hypothetical protein